MGHKAGRPAGARVVFVSETLHDLGPALPVGPVLPDVRTEVPAGHARRP
jgi:hypothetical protein